VQLVELLEAVLGGEVVALGELGAGDQELGLDGVAAEREADPHEVGVGDRLVPVAVLELAAGQLVVLAGGLAVVGAEVGAGLAGDDNCRGLRGSWDRLRVHVYLAIISLLFGLVADPLCLSRRVRG
jgi:hypothetical protein